ncbi:MAG: B12-binding domain-containing radical SAM protein [Magnetococcales bacterium]|nr:B12-binding domain-containing radical SAM protein [Magnetococcales bacterium]MBF0322251.1 B12-binding domain-containing radical SAM protein [Magnetococcales bacterium]
MKIALIIPRSYAGPERSFYDYRFYTEFLFTRKHFSYLLAIPTLAALTPKNHTVRIFDEHLEDIDFSWVPDLVGISARTMFAKRAYEISAMYRQRGVKTVLGGIHPSMCMEESLAHCDTVVSGEAEQIWPVVLQDAEKGVLQRSYQADTLVDLKRYPLPDRQGLSHCNYLLDVIQTTKGCPFRCEFCSVYAYDGNRVRHKSVEQVLDEIHAVGRTEHGFDKKKSIFFADDNIIANKKFALELFQAIKPLNLSWSCQASVNLAKDDVLLQAMRESGCGAVLIGLESIDAHNLAQMNKDVNLKYDYATAIARIQATGILVHASFIVGYDGDTQASFDHLADFIAETNLLGPVINILTPFPGTPLFERMKKEGRILHEDWNRYDSNHVVFKPSPMTPEALLTGHRRLIRKVYSFPAIWKRLNHYWERDFWAHSNRHDPVKLKYRLLFALRLLTFLFSTNLPRSRFILRLLPKMFDSRVRISTILPLLAFNAYAYQEVTDTGEG